MCVFESKKLSDGTEPINFEHNLANIISLREINLRRLLLAA